MSNIPIKKTRWDITDENENKYTRHLETSADIVLYKDSTVANKLDDIIEQLNPEDTAYVYKGSSSITLFPNIEIVDDFVAGNRLYIEPIEYIGNSLNFISVFGYTDPSTNVTLTSRLNVGDSVNIDLDRSYIKVRIVFNLTAIESCSYQVKFKKINEISLIDQIKALQEHVADMESRLQALEE